MPEPVLMKLRMYIMTSEPISMAYFINPSNQSVCLYVYPSIVARQRLGKKSYRCNAYTSNNRRTVQRVVFYDVRVE
jgi:hypothetical protein